MKFCLKDLSCAATICIAVATIFMILAVFVPCWQYAHETEEGGSRTYFKKGLWQSCYGGSFEFKGCILLDTSDTGVWLNVVRGLVITACVGFLLAFGANLILNSYTMSIDSYKGMKVLYITTVAIAGILAFAAVQIYSRHLDYDREYFHEVPSEYTTQLGYCAYFTFIAGVFGVATLFLSNLILTLTRDDGYQKLKGSRFV